MNRKELFYLLDLEKQCDIIDKIQRAIMKQGGRLFSRRELLDMKLDELIFICTRNDVKIFK